MKKIIFINNHFRHIALTMSIQKIASYFIIFIAFFTMAMVCNAQPKHFNKMFHPQTNENIMQMKNSSQKIVNVYAVWDGTTTLNDSDNYLQHEQFYNENGLLALDKDATQSKWYTYKYDKKGRVIEYLEEYFNDNAKGKPALHFAVEYSRKGEIIAIKNLDRTKQAQSITFNINTKTILISDIGGYIYRYTLDKKNRLIKAKVEYYMSTRYNSTLGYTKKGLLLEESGTKESKSTSFIFTTKYLYNKGVLVKKTTTAKPKNLTAEQIKSENYVYKNALLSRKEISDNGNKIIYNYTYDNLQRLIKTTYTKADSLYGTEFYVYR